MLLGAVCAVGCTSEEGILVAVSGSSVDILQFHVGVKQGSDFVLDRSISTPTPLRIGVSGRGLNTNPFELLIEREQPTDLALRVLVIGLRRKSPTEEQVHSLGVTDPPQPFVTGEVVRRALPLYDVRWDRSVTKIGSCYRARLGDDYYRLVPDKDRDCDGYETPVDCDDGNSAINPTALEVCDGLDDNCDGKKISGGVPCYALEGDACYAGTRSCSEASGGGLGPKCEIAGEPVAAAYCQAYSDCKAPDPQTCSSKVKPATFSCTLEKKPGGADCGFGEIALEPPTSAEKCLWRIVDKGGFDVGLLAPNACKTTLKVNGHAAGKVTIEFIKGTPDKTGQVVWKAGWVREYSISLVDAEPCSEQPLTCK